jgi:hypothetical protein
MNNKNNNYKYPYKRGYSLQDDNGKWCGGRNNKQSRKTNRCRKRTVEKDVRRRAKVEIKENI